MKLFKHNLNKEKTAAFVLSILVHGILFLIIMFIKIEYTQFKKAGYSIVNFVQVTPEESKAMEKEEPAQKIKKIFSIQKKEPEKIQEKKIVQTSKTILDTISNKKIIDTASNKGKIYISSKQLADTTYRLKFAATLLDSFLVRHPEYSRYILQQQAKELVENKNIKKFSRLALEQRVNEELDKYLKEYYPEGSEHEINPIHRTGSANPYRWPD